MNYIKTSKGYCYIDERGFHFSTEKNESEVCEYVNQITLNDSKEGRNLKNKKISKIVFFMTRKCNLNCIYCYADAGNVNDDISIEHAYTVIDYISSKADEIIIDFHGGGEPLMAFESIQKIHEYSKNTGKLKDTVLITNGYIKEKEKLEWIKENVDRLAISLDGDSFIQNRNRITKDYSNSYSVVIETIKFLTENQKKFVVRATITNETTKSMKNIVEHFHNNGIKDIILSPCYNFGRSNDFDLLPEPKAYVENFIQAFEYAYKNNLNLRTSSFRVPGNDYCGAIPGFNMGVTTDGYISTCYEVISNDDKVANDFIVGTVNTKDKKIDFDLDKLKRLKRMEELKIECNDCGFKLVCRGRCPVKVIRNNQESALNICKISKQLIPKLLDYIHNNPKSAKVLLNNIDIYL